MVPRGVFGENYRTESTIYTLSPYRSKMPWNGFTSIIKSLPQLLPMTRPVLGIQYSPVAKSTEVGEALADVWVVTLVVDSPR